MTDAKRGSQAVFEFDEVKYGVLHMPQFATIEYLTDDIGAEWNSGEVVSVEIFDPDMNFDQRSEDVMTVASNSINRTSYQNWISNHIENIIHT